VLRAFDYLTISDVILTVRHTARPAGDPLASQATKELVTMLDTQGQASQALLFVLRYDFPTEWSSFINGTGNFQVTLAKQDFPYVVQSAKKLTVDALSLYSANGTQVASVTPTVDLGALSTALSGTTGSASLNVASDPNVLIRQQSQQVFMVLRYHFGSS
jgi:hypothetical protein